MSAEENKTEAPTEEAKPKGSIEEWPEPVDSRCIHLAVNDLTKHIFLKEEDAYMAVIWLCHSMMFEAWDTSTDIGVIPDEGTENSPKRKNLKWITIKPKGAMHMDYQGDYITDSLKQNIFKAIEFFLSY